MKSLRSRILLFAVLAGIATAAFIAHQPATDLGSGFTSEAANRFAFSKVRRDRRHVWLTSPDGTRTQLSEAPTSRQTLIHSNSVVLWVESRVIGRMPFQDVRGNFILAADSDGHRVELTPWLKTRAAKVLPVASPTTLWAISGSEPAPLEAPGRDPRIGVKNFTPDFVELAFWRPGITFWCSVPCNGSNRSLPMEVPLDEIAAYLREQSLVSTRP